MIRSSCAKQVALISPTVSDVCLLCLNVQPIGFWVEESLHLSPSCVHDYGILH